MLGGMNPAGPGIALPVPTGWGQVGQGFDPQRIAEDQAKKAQADQAKAEAEGAQDKVAADRMAYLARMARANKSYLSDPSFIQQMEKLSKQAKLPSVIDPRTGTINLDAIPGSGSVYDWTPAERKEAASLSPAQKRVLYPGQSKDFLDAPAELSPVEAKALRDDFLKAVMNVSSGGSIESLRLFMMGAGAKLEQAMGPDGIEAALHELGSPQSQQLIGQMAQARIGQLAASGFSAQAQAAYREMLTKEKPLEVQSLIDHRTNMDTIAQQRENVYDMATMTRVNTQWAQVQAKSQSLKIEEDKARAQIANWQANTNNSGAKLALAQAKYGLDTLKTQAGVQEKLVDSLTKQLDALMQADPRKAAKLIGMDPDKPGEYIPGSLGDQLKQARAALDATQASIATFDTAVKSGSPEQRMQAATGAPTSVQSATLRQGGAVPGWPGFVFTGERNANGKWKGVNPSTGQSGWYAP